MGKGLPDFYVWRGFIFGLHLFGMIDEFLITYDIVILVT